MLSGDSTLQNRELVSPAKSASTWDLEPRKERTPHCFALSGVVGRCLQRLAPPQWALSSLPETRHGRPPWTSALCLDHREATLLGSLLGSPFAGSPVKCLCLFPPIVVPVVVCSFGHLLSCNQWYRAPAGKGCHWLTAGASHL